MTRENIYTRTWLSSGQQWATSEQFSHFNILVYTVRLLVNAFVYILEGIGKIPLKKDAGADETMVFKTYEPEKVCISIYTIIITADFEMA